MWQDDRLSNEISKMIALKAREYLGCKYKDVYMGKKSVTLKICSLSCLPVIAQLKKKNK